MEPPPPAVQTDGHTPCGTVAIATEQADGTYVTLVWDVPAYVAVQGIAQLTEQFGPADSEMTATSEAAKVAADFLSTRHGVVRIDHD